MIVMSCDLSTTCTGVTIATIERGIVQEIDTLAIIPKFSPKDVGYLATKHDVVLRNGKKVKSLVKYKGEQVSSGERKRRDREFRNTQRLHRLRFIGAKLGELIDTHRPNLILYEQNMAFGAILTTKQLAEIAGSLNGIAASRGIDIKEYNVNQVRAKYNVVNVIKEFVVTIPPDKLKKMKDIDKEAFKYLMLKKYPMVRKDITLDESDSLVILDYWRGVNV